MRSGILLLLLLLSQNLCAQTRDWSTIRENDTPYFAGGVFGTKSPSVPAPYYSISGRLIRRITVDSVQTSGAEKTLFFPAALRSVDTSPLWPGRYYMALKPSWQGSFCLQKDDSVDEFYNFLGDTIRVHIRATPLDSWKLLTDSSGLEIRASITAMGSTILNGVPDSFREATLQAYRNNMVTAHYANGKKLRWTKAQGWVKTLDWYVFPYGSTKPPGSYPPVAGAKEDSASYDRIDDSVDLSKGVTIADLQRRYAPGNAWRMFYEDAMEVRLGRDHYWYDYDSVLNSTIVGNTCIAQLQRSSCDFQFIPPSGSVNPLGYWQVTPQSGVPHTDTVVADSLIRNKRQWISPDLGWVYLLTDTLCGQPQVCMDADDGDDFSARDYSQNASRIGNTAYYRCGPYSEIYMLSKYSRLEYLKTAACTYGNYINVPALLVGNIALANAFSFFPNPAKDLLHLCLPDGVSNVEITLTDVQSRVLKTQSIRSPEATISVSDLPAGLYLLRLSGKVFSQTQKLLIAR